MIQQPPLEPWALGDVETRDRLAASGSGAGKWNAPYSAPASPVDAITVAATPPTFVERMT